MALPIIRLAQYRPSLFTVVALVLALVVGGIFASAVDESRSWGWDESMHAGLPAERIALALEAGDMGELADVIHGCMQYPFVWPLLVGTLHAQLGSSNAPSIVRGSPQVSAGIETLGRVAGRWSFALLIFGLALLSRELWSAPRMPWVLLMAPLLALASPLLIDYSGTWFLEVPFATAATFTLLFWTHRAHRLMASIGEPAQLAKPTKTWLLDFTTGALIAAAFFTKFNYGLLLGFGLALDLTWDLVLALRGRGPLLSRFLLATLRLALLPALVFVWWFLLPLPLGQDIAAAHREAFFAFIGGNLDLTRTPGSIRLLHWATSFVATPRLLLLLMIGLVTSLAFCLRWLRSGCANARNQLRLWVVLVAVGVPILTHNFHLDRFLIVFIPLVMPLAAAGWAVLFAAVFGRLLDSKSTASAYVSIVFVPVLLIGGLITPAWDGQRVFARTVGFSTKPEVRSYQEQVLAERQSIAPRRHLSTAGLDRQASNSLLGLVETQLEELGVNLGRPARFAWLGISSELSPAAVHIGVHDLAGEPQRLREDAGAVRLDGMPTMIVTFEGQDPGWNDDQLLAWAASFDVVFTSVPPDLRGRRARDFIRGYQERLIGSGTVGMEELGTIQVSQPIGPSKPVRLFSLTPIVP